MTTQTAIQINEISAWVDEHLAGKSAEARLWHRIGKIGEEHGEVIEALIGATNGNPRKPGSHTPDDVRKELLDVALTALCAWAHMSGNTGDPLTALGVHTTLVHSRAGLRSVDHRNVSEVAPDGMVRPACSCTWAWGGFTTAAIAASQWREHTEGVRRP